MHAGSLTQTEQAIFIYILGKYVIIIEEKETIYLKESKVGYLRGVCRRK